MTRDLPRTLLNYKPKWYRDKHKMARRIFLEWKRTRRLAVETDEEKDYEEVLYSSLI
jgi:hypothetical protein